MTMRTVYRIENADGDGPYATGTHWPQDMYDPFRCPAPRADRITTPFGDWERQSAYDPAWLRWLNKTRFGFTSREQLLRWFRGSLFRAYRQGYRAVTYMVPPGQVWEGGHQCVFDHVNAVATGPAVSLAA